ncbi:unnamed protein product [Albugo candida]|uniref:Uncharacterized protein n=1 Tax=Albugo candida TaxID=65357 RepID=A0A024G415_9STRA|nr:unnamed protein product [Albugo candida]|eukprot:CCI41604.1 unnamed protein product [Albugo candida]
MRLKARHITPLQSTCACLYPSPYYMIYISISKMKRRIRNRIAAGGISCATAYRLQAKVLIRLKHNIITGWKWKLACISLSLVKVILASVLTSVMVPCIHGSLSSCLEHSIEINGMKWKRYTDLVDLSKPKHPNVSKR